MCVCVIERPERESERERKCERESERKIESERERAKERERAREVDSAKGRERARERETSDERRAASWSERAALCCCSSSSRDRADNSSCPSTLTIRPNRPISELRFTLTRRASVRISGFEFWISGFEFQVSGFEFRVSGFEFRVPGFEFWVRGFEFRVSGFEFRVPGFEFGVWCFEFGVWGFARTSVSACTCARYGPASGGPAPCPSSLGTSSSALGGVPFGGVPCATGLRAAGALSGSLRATFLPPLSAFACERLCVCVKGCSGVCLST